MVTKVSKGIIGRGPEEVEAVNETELEVEEKRGQKG